ncbi:hypothetical protein ACIOHC_43795, partial [Streptomyces sp. NPDC088252]|uniref:hypothetical protein n=1 Tax=Streptomyces sp. NPDC088252 TaxID=3365845 RepID=UPI003817DEFB
MDFLGLDLAALRGEPVWAGVMNRLVVEMAKLPGSLRSDPNALEDLAERLANEVNDNVQPELREWVERQDRDTGRRWMSHELAVRPLGPVVRAWAQANAVRENADRLGMDHAVARVFAMYSLPVGVDVAAVMELAHHWGLDAKQVELLMVQVRTLGRFPEAVVGLTRALDVGPHRVFALARLLGVLPEHLVLVSDELSGLLDGVLPEERVASGADVLRRRLAEAGFVPEDLRWFAGSGLQLRVQDLVGFRSFVRRSELELGELRSRAADRADGLVRGWLADRSEAEAAAGAAFREHQRRAEVLLSNALRRTTLEAATRRLWNVSDDLLIQHDSDLGPLFLEDSDRALFFPQASDLALLFPQDIAALHQYVERRGALDEEGWERWVKFMRSQFDMLGLRTAEDWAAFPRLIQTYPELFAPRPGQEASGSQTAPDPGLGSARYLPLNQFLRNFLGLELVDLRGEPVWAGAMNHLVTEMAELPGSLRSDPNALQDLSNHLTAEVYANVPSERRAWVKRQGEHASWRWFGYELAVRQWGPVVREWAQAYAERQGASDESEPYTDIVDIAPRVRAALDGLER